MTNSKEELIVKIEEAREKMNDSIDKRENYNDIYKKSVELDELLNQYMVAEK